MSEDPPDEVFNDAIPLPLPDDIDYRRFGLLLRKIEAAADRGGWDQPYAGLTLSVLYDNSVTGTAEHFDNLMGENPSLGRALRIGPYSAQKFMPPIWLARCPGKPFEAARHFAVVCTYAPAPGPDDPEDAPDVGVMRRWMRQPGVLGFAAVYEAWDRSHCGDPTSDLMTGRHVDWGTLPGSQAVRVVLAVDFLDQTHTVVRREVDACPGEVHHNSGIRGDLSTTLRILTDMAYSRSPRPSQFDSFYLSLTAHVARMAVEGAEIAEVERIVAGGSGRQQVP